MRASSRFGRMVRLGLYAALATLGPTAARADRMNLLVPAYFYPGGDRARYWQMLDRAAPKVSLWVIVNPASGPGTKVDPVYRAAVTSLRRAGGKTLAYVDTSYGARPRQTVLKDIDDWLAFYPGLLDGFFLDQVTSDAKPEHIDYLAPIYRYVKQKGARLIVMGNPGTNAEEAYLARPVCDALMTFENGASTYPEYKVDAWTARYPPSRFAHILHTTPSTMGAVESSLQLARRRRAGWIFLTDAVYRNAQSNPYDCLPTYWDKLVSLLQGGRP